MEGDLVVVRRPGGRLEAGRRGGSFGSGLEGFRPLGTNVVPEEPVLASDVEAWDCSRHGHLVTLWVPFPGGEKGACLSCGREETRAVEVSEMERKLVCPRCEGTRWRATLVQRALGLRGTVPCECVEDDADR